jgi:cardiolipin synthase
VSIPNVLTGLRLVAVPVFAWLYLSGRHGAALGVFVAAAVTDVLDGVLARALRQFTRWGAVMDPLADKALALVALALLTWSALLPPWLLGLALFKDACIFTAIWLLTKTGRTYEVRPTRFGKYTAFFLVATIVLALWQEARAPSQAASPALLALCLITGLCVVLSWAQYLALLVVLMRKPPDAAARKLSPGWLANAIAGPRMQAKASAGAQAARPAPEAK